MKNQDFPLIGNYNNCIRIRYLIFLSLFTLIALIYFNSSQLKFSPVGPNNNNCPTTSLGHQKVLSNINNNGNDHSYSSAAEDDSSVTLLDGYLNIYNQLGYTYQQFDLINQSSNDPKRRSRTGLTMLEKLVTDQNDSSGLDESILSINYQNYDEIQEKLKSLHQTGVGNKRRLGSSQKERKIVQKINLAVVACGQRKDEALVMLKSALMFSQDALLHVILFSDEDTILDLAASLMKLKWTVNALGWDFTFELHLDWFPNDKNAEWKKMWTPCSTQRLFFPSLLPHIDSVIYLDTDTIILSNLTQFWIQFDTNLRDQKIAGMASNNELTAKGWYNTNSKVPFYGKRGLNAGVMLMNLKLMRSWEFEDKSISIHRVYKEKIELADQDILNILFHGFPEKLHLLDCSYNFNWVHCGYGAYLRCHYDETGDSFCFCNATFTHGIQILHGNGHTFYNKDFPFLQDIYSEFNKFDFLQTSYLDLFTTLRKKFIALNPQPCHPLTTDILYNNAKKYFTTLGFQM